MRGGYNGLLQNFVLVCIEFLQLFGFIGRSEKVLEFRYLHSNAAFCFATMDCQFLRSFYLAVLHLHAKCLCTVQQMRLVLFNACFVFLLTYLSANLSNSWILWLHILLFYWLHATTFWLYLPEFRQISWTWEG